MKAYLIEGLRRGFIGMLMGVFLSHTLIVMASAGQTVVQLDVNELMIYYFGYGLGAFWFSAISIFFNVEEWSLLRQFTTHIIFSLPFLPVAYATGFMTDVAWGRAVFIGAYIGCYVLSYIIYRLHLVRQASIINDVL